nr:helix-turn-helix transcriptional regulator [Pseudomonas chlororaphis]
MIPDAKAHNPEPGYLRALIDQTGLTQEEVAQRIGITGRAMRNYLSTTEKRKAPYAVQFALECLANSTRQSE